MKLSPIFLYLFLLVGCIASKQVQNLNPISHIEQEIIYFSDGKKAKLPVKKAKGATTIFLVRHAEKAKSGGKDPVLTAEGNQRAQRLKNILAKASINRIYSTEYKRTQLTAKPTADAFKKEISFYDPRDLPGFAQQIKSGINGENILIVGHSNTTPALVNALIGEEQFPMIEEHAYGHLFVVTIRRNGKTNGMDLRY